MDWFKWIPQSLLGGDHDGDEEEDLLGGLGEGTCSLSPLQRLYCFAASLVVGFAFMFLSLIVVYKPVKFAVMFTFGNILAVGSTAFLIGPVQQARLMLEPVRIYSTLIYVGCVALALIFALWLHSKVLTLIAVICEICALIWYSLSYVPFARQMVSELFMCKLSLHEEALRALLGSASGGRYGFKEQGAKAPCFWRPTRLASHRNEEGKDKEGLRSNDGSDCFVEAGALQGGGSSSAGFVCR